jgi:hypothetical protein
MEHAGDDGFYWPTVVAHHLSEQALLSSNLLQLHVNASGTDI